jgi:hypothetical protein
MPQVAILVVLVATPALLAQSTLPTGVADSYSVVFNTPRTVPAPGVLANDNSNGAGALTANLETGPAHGTLVFTSTGSFTYTPNAGFQGPDNFTYRPVTSVGAGAPAMVTLTVGPPPAGVADSYSVVFNKALSVPVPGVLGNDDSHGAASLSAVLDSGPAHGTLVFTSTGSFTYTPNAGFQGSDTFTYHPASPVAQGTTAVVTLTVGPPPAGVADNFSVVFNTPLAVPAPGVLGNDNSHGAGALTAILLTGPSHGTLVFSSTGSFTYTPNAGFQGTDIFTYRPASSVAQGTTAAVTLTVGPPPAGVADSFSVVFNTPRTVPAPGVLVNDNSHGAGALTATLQVGPSHGTLVFNANGSFTYTPNTGFQGPDTFTYRPASSVAQGTTAAVTLTVGPPPAGVADSFTVGFNTPLAVPAPGVLGNDISHGAASLTANLITGPSHGTLVFNSNGSFTYTPNAGYQGPDSFTYRPASPVAQGTTAAVTLTVGQPPTAVADSYSVVFNTPLTVAAPGVLGNDNANGGGTLTATLLTTTAQGTLVLAANGGFTYTPQSGFSGTDTFTYRANAAGPGGTATVTLTVGPPPTSVADSYNVAFNTPLTVPAPGVLGNDNANGGGALTAVLVTSTSHGALSLAGNGGFTYTPQSGFSGTDTFTYRATAAGPGGTATVTLTVGLPPTTAGDTFATDFETRLSVPAPGVLANDSSNGGGALSAVLVSSTSNGALSLAANGSFTYTPNSGFAGIDSFTYRAQAGGPGNTATVSITVGEPTTIRPPTDLYVSAMAGNTVTFRFTPPAVGPDATGFVLEGGINPGEVLASLATNSASPIFTVVAPTGSFFVRFHALNGAEKSGPSNEIRVHVNVPVPPSAPDRFGSTVNGTSLLLAWRNTFAGGQPSGLVLDVSGSANVQLPLGPGESFAVNGVPGGTYTLRLRAVNGGGSSPASEPITVTIPSACAGPPSPPAGFLAYRRGNTLIVVWEPATTGPGAASYLLNVTGSFVGSLPIAARSVSATVGPGAYTLSVTAMNACGSSATTPAQTVVVP